MKLAYVAGFAWDPKGTVRARAFPLAAEMARRGHEVTLFIAPYDNPKYSGMEFLRDGVQIINLEVPQGLSAAYAAIPGKLASVVTDFAPDLVHVFKPKGFAGMAAAKLLRSNHRPLVIDCDDWEGWGGWNEVKSYPWVMKEFIDRQEHSLIRRSHIVTCASRVLANRAFEMGKAAEHIFYLPNGVSTQQSRLAEQLLKISPMERKRALGFGRPPVLFYAGNFDLADDVEFFCRAIARLSLRQKITVALVGDGPRFSHARDMLAALNEVNVRTFGKLTYEEYASVLAASDVAAFPYPDTPVYRAKCSVRIIDYMLYAKPIITTAIGQNNDYIVHEESGLLIPPEAAAALENGLMRLLTDAALRERLGRNARHRVLQEFHWSGNLGNTCESAYQRAFAMFHHRSARADKSLALSS